MERSEKMVRGMKKVKFTMRIEILHFELNKVRSKPIMAEAFNWGAVTLFIVAIYVLHISEYSYLYLGNSCFNRNNIHFIVPGS